MLEPRAKPPTLLELTGPLFMPYPAVSNVQFRLSEEGGGTRLRFVHRAMAQIAHDAQLVDGWGFIEGGWDRLVARIQAAAHERSHAAHAGSGSA